MVFQRIQGRRRQQARLPHATAGHLADAVRAGDEVPSSRTAPSPPARPRPLLKQTETLSKHCGDAAGFQLGTVSSFVISPPAPRPR
jgi:hypothetical protein